MRAEEASEERNKAEARAQIAISTSHADALVAKARGEAQAYREKIEALGGVENMVMLEVASRAVERWDGTMPEVLATGGGADAALVSSMLHGLQQAQAEQSP